MIIQLKHVHGGLDQCVDLKGNRSSRQNKVGGGGVATQKNRTLPQISNLGLVFFRFLSFFLFFFRFFSVFSVFPFWPILTG